MIWVEPAVLGRLAAMHRLHESYFDMVVRLVELDAQDYGLTLC